MKNIYFWIIVTLSLCCAAGCNTDYVERLDELKARADSLEAQCLRMNQSISSVSEIVKAIQENDLITGITEIKEGNKVVGYRINFVSSSPITVYDGVDGPVPYVGTKQDSDGSIYWTIRYGAGGALEWLLDGKGEKILAVGEIPYLSVKDGVWRYTLDGKNWVDLGPSRGKDADSMFKKVDVSGELFVVFHLVDGTVLKVPKYEAYTKLYADVVSVNDDIAAQKHILETMFDGAIYIVSLEEQFADGVRTGVKVSLSDGSSFVIKDWVKSIVPIVLAEKDTADDTYYWSCRYADDRPFWITDSKGERIRAVTERADEMPIVSIRMNGEEGNYYWYVTYAGDGWFVTDTDGEKIDVETSGAFAADTVQHNIFKSVFFDEDSLNLVFRDGADTVRVLRQYAVTLSSPGLSGRTLTIEDGAGCSAEVTYEATGAQVRDVVAIVEGNLSVRVDREERKFTVTKKSAGQGSVSLIFTFAEENSTNTRFIKLSVQ